MAGPPIEPRTIYVDRFATPAFSLSLAALMVPASAVQPSAMVITAGNGAGHWDVTSGALSPSTAGDAADLSAGVYTFTVQGTWSVYGGATNSATLKVICPAASVYVDPATGIDTQPGTKAQPWAHAPDDPLATGVAAAYANPAVETLCVFKDGSFIRSKIVQTRSKLVYASGVGWGTGLGTATYCGADICPTGTTPSSGEILSNPLSGILKHSFATAQHPGQNMIDRSNNSLLHWAQFPAAGADPFNDAYDPGRHLTGGMYQGPASAVVPNGAASTFTLPADFVTEFGSKDLNGCILGLWIKSNYVGFFDITGYNTSTKVATFDIGGAQVQDDGAGKSAYQIIGSPWSIKAAGQYAWSVDRKDRFCKTVSGTTPEILVCDNGANLTAIASGAIYGMSFEGYWGTTDSQGCGVGCFSSSDYTINVLGCNARWLSSYGNVGAGVRSVGVGKWTNSLIEGNTVIDGVRSSGIRIGSSVPTNIQVNSNTLKRLSATALYIGSAVNSKVLRNTLEDIIGVHANGITIYIVNTDNPHDIEVAFNTCKNVARPMTCDAMVNMASHDNIFECDATIFEPVRLYGTSSTFTSTRDIYARRRNTPTVNCALQAGSSGNLGVYSGCVIDGLSGGVTATFSNCLISNHAASENDVTANVAPDSGNVFVQGQWDGTLPPRWKLQIGTGGIGRDYMAYGIASVQITNLINQDISAVATSAWMLVTSDATWPISVTGGEFRIANDAIGTGATAWGSTASTVANGKYIQIRLTTTSSYDNVNSMTLDLSNGNVYTWTVKTKQASGWPFALVAKTYYWRPVANYSVGASTSKTMTWMFAGRIDQMTLNDIFVGYYNGGTYASWCVKVLPTNKLRFQLYNAAGQVAEIDSPSLSSYYGQLITMLVTFDTAQSTAVAGTKMYINGASIGSPTSGQWTQDALLNWPVSNQLCQVSNFDGLIGAIWHSPTLLDITDVNVRDKFTPLRIKTDGSGPTGSAPPMFMVGVASDWNSTTTGFNRGSGAKYKRMDAGAAIALDSGGASTWPPYTLATAITLSGANGNVGVATTYSATITGALADPGTIALSDGGAGGTFSPTSLSPVSSTTTQVLTFTYTPASTGAKTLTASMAGLTSATLGITAQPAVATSYTLTGASSANVGDAVTLTVTLNGSNPSGARVAFGLSGVTGTFSFNPQVVSAGISTATVTFTPTTAGTAVITPTNTEGLTNPAAKSITVAGGGVVSAPRLRLGLGLGL